MIKKVKTQAELTKVEAYLLSKKTVPASQELYYKEDKDGNIVGAYAIEMKLCIEPLQADNKFTAFELFTDAKATARAYGQDKIHFFTTNPKAITHLIKDEDAVKWGSGLTELIIQS